MHIICALQTKSPIIKTDCVLQVFCVFLFLTAAIFFGTLISQVNEIVAAQTTQNKELDDTLASYLSVHPR
jgi:hypothetical protein